VSDLDAVANRIMVAAAQSLDDEHFARLYSPEGLAPTCDWQAEDDWIVSYTTKRIRGGTLGGAFAVFVYRPIGPGSRSGNAKRWQREQTITTGTRREAKERAVAIYYAHSPIKAAKHGK
jgi:hypothetical protein